ncbi:hypothetical protein N7517_005033 [Penicillium concentricum]|uniref:Uncharacterized protein n=1 Tax=Penicillium concentricum TaxID=293559 RepID=A0A9W9S6M4_9EURO|nr:uncharacterized protein N7517_005033 [Penicillium concentricum]KAJ5373027.1 hypothetical protein N7517_005033 [Penicillium concentricum]
MPSYKNDPPDQEYLDSIKKHTDKETNKVDMLKLKLQVNLALVAKDFGYASGKSFQKNDIETNFIDQPEISSTEAAPTEVAQTPPKETIKATKSIMDIVNEHIHTYLAQRGSVDKSKSSEEKQKKHS